MEQWYSDAYFPRCQIHVIREDVRFNLKGNKVTIYSYFMLEQAIVRNIFPEVQVRTWQVIARGEAEGNSVSSRYLHQGENVLHYCLFKLEITVLLPNCIPDM